ncbi:MAG: YdeI/OmpD-associated family protein [Actinomycetota bacterium]|nr:YdeI/OmpD-associated family protein [Actinomycetota bacterium]
MPTFTTTLHQQGNNVGIIVPDVVVAELGAGKRPLVTVTINGSYTFVYTVAVMGGRNMIGFSSAHRAASGLNGGDEVEIELQLETAPREVELPPELSAALAADPVAAAAFEKLSFTFRKEHARSITEAKAEETRQRRLDKIMAGLRGER